MYKVGQYLRAKNYPEIIIKILKVDTFHKKIFTKNIDPNENHKGNWNSIRVIKKYLDIIPGYDTPLWKTLNDKTR